LVVLTSVGKGVFRKSHNLDVFRNLKIKN